MIPTNWLEWIAHKGAIYELRNYPEYRNVILRICDDAPTLFAPAYDPRVAVEFAETAAQLRRGWWQTN